MYKVKLFETQAIIDSFAILRNKNTNINDFKFHADRIFKIVGEEILNDLPKINVQIPTPVDDSFKNYEISDSANVLLVGILRSGLPAAEGIKSSMPDATLGLLDIKRSHETSLPSLNYNGLKKLDLKKFNKIIIPDPMLATGGSASMAIEILKNMGAKFNQMQIYSLVSAPEGIVRINELYPEIKITTTAVDERLNDKNYIVPGLGDFGDRYFGNHPFMIQDKINGVNLAYHQGILSSSNNDVDSIF